MAVLPGIPGLEVILGVDGEIFSELLDSASYQPEQAQITKYICSAASTEYKIHVKMNAIDPIFKYNNDDIHGLVLLDGVEVYNFITEKDQLTKEEVISGAREYIHGI
jgi:hypothetical protein